MLYQTVGYTDNNQDPSEEHINDSLMKALKVPAGSRMSFRIWLPHRAGGRQLVDKVWDWFINHTTGAISHATIKNCGHIAIFMLAPEEQGKYKDAVDTPIDQKTFVGGLFDGDDRIDGRDNIMHFIRNIASTQYISSIEYARQLQDRGYDVGFQGCIIQRSRSFNERFGEHFNTGPVMPMMIVYAGTEASAVKHSFQRGKINIDTVKDRAFIQPDWLDGWINRPTEGMPDNCAEELYRWNADKSALLPLSDSEILGLKYRKFPFIP